MKTLLKISLVLALGLSANSVMAFHDGGVADCAGCHTMHNSQDGGLVDADSPNGNAYLLIDGSASDTCLSCHAAYGQFAGGTGWGPGGDFYWLTKTYTWTAHSHAYESTGDSHGHNIVAPGAGLAADGMLTVAPGGDFAASELSCTSCHDPHGNENFMLLYGTEVGPIYPGGRYDFTEGAPLAAGNGQRTVGASRGESNTRHTIYKSGMSEWCANCHTTFHADNTTAFVHPTGEAMGSAVAENYNAYISSDQMIGGSEATSYWGLVPFEAVNVDLAADPRDYTAGPTPNDQVMCLSCHRAHASPFADMARWDMGETFMAEAHPQATDGNATDADLANMWYGYQLSPNQRSLCNKCHIKDLGDERPFEVVVQP